ncbi:hypothetical protein [Azospirillum endophyticum]
MNTVPPWADALPFPHECFSAHGWPELISLDVFDTLLLRQVDTPAAVFDEVGRRALEAGLVDRGLTPPLFRLARQAAERRARELRAGGEVDILDIYRQGAFGDPGQLAALELAVEQELLFANPLMCRFLQKLAEYGVPVVLLSDMYIQAEDLQCLLRAAGVKDDWYRTLYVSCSHRASKREGGLFRILLKDFAHISPDRILHIGDDPLGDVATARSAGLRAVHYAPSSALSRMQDREKSLSRLSAGSVSLPLRRLAALAGLRHDGETAFWHEFGSLILGPAIAEYCRWVVEDCHSRGISLIAPLMREAAIFAPLMTDWIRHQGYSMRVVPLFVSRQALAPLQFTGMSSTHARAFLSTRPHLSWGALLSELGGNIPPNLTPWAELPLDALAEQRGPDGSLVEQGVLDLFDAPHVRRQADERAKETRALVLDHLAERLGATNHVALVDLGARASTPAALAALEPRGRQRFDIYLCYGVADLAPLLADGLRVHVFCGETAMGMDLGRILYRSPQVLERALTGLSGSTLGYRRDEEGHCVPVTAPAPAQGDEARALHLMQSGIRCYAELLRTVALPSNRAPAPREVAFLPLAAALSMPTPSEAQRLGALWYDYNDGTHLEREICDADAMTGVGMLASGEGPMMGMAVGLRPLLVPWPQGALTRLNPDVFWRHADGLNLEAGHGPVCRALVRRIRSLNLDHVAVIAVGGDGGMGPDFIHTARDAGINLVGYTDLMTERVPFSVFHGVPVIAMDRMPDEVTSPIVLVTLGYADRLAALLRARFSAAGRSLRLIALGRPDLENASPDGISDLTGKWMGKPAKL